MELIGISSVVTKAYEAGCNTTFSSITGYSLSELKSSFNFFTLVPHYLNLSCAQWIDKFQLADTK